MGIQLSDHDRNMIKQMAAFIKDRIPTRPYLYGYLSSRVGSFLTGGITREQLAEDHALLELLETLEARCTPEQLLQIVDGTRELPGEDVPSGQST